MKQGWSEESSSKKNNKVKLLFCLDKGESVDDLISDEVICNWYSIDPNSEGESDGMSPLRIHPVLPEMNRSHRLGYGCCAVGSKIYVFGGQGFVKQKIEKRKEKIEQVPGWDYKGPMIGWNCDGFYEEKVMVWDDVEVVHQANEAHSLSTDDPMEEEEEEEEERKPVLCNDIFVCDVDGNSSPTEWNKVASMQSPRCYPQVIPIDGRIYIFGSNLYNLDPADPWAEVFDLSNGKCTSLDDPPLLAAQANNLGLSPPCYPMDTLPTPCITLKHFIFHKKKIALDIHTNLRVPGCFSFDTETRSWDQFHSVPHSFVDCGNSAQSVVVDQVLYTFTYEGLAFCKLDQEDLTVHLISGLERFTETIEFGPDLTQYSFFHLADQDFFLVWFSPVYDGPGYNQLLRTLKFRIHQKEQPQDWIAVVDTCNFYLAAGVELRACLKMGEESNLQEEEEHVTTLGLVPSVPCDHGGCQDRIRRCCGKREPCSSTAGRMKGKCSRPRVADAPGGV